MAAQLTTKVIVKNLPVSWTFDHLVNFLEVETSLMIADDGTQLFRDITHTALLTLEEPVTEQSLIQYGENLTQKPFEGKALSLEAVQPSTCGLLVNYTYQEMTHDHVSYYFDNPACSGCGDAEVTQCEMYPEVSLAVVHFSLPEGVTGVLAKGNHVLKQGGEVLGVEPWYEQFHRPLLNNLLSSCRPKEKPSVPPKPKEKPPVPPKPEFSTTPVPPKPEFDTTPVPSKPEFDTTPVPPKPEFDTTPVPPKPEFDTTLVPPKPEFETTPVPPKPEFDTTPVPSKLVFSTTPMPYTPPNIVETLPDQSDKVDLRRENERLRLENLKLKTCEAEKQDEVHSDTITENERLKSENEKLKKPVSIQRTVAAHQLRLLADFASIPREGCHVTLMEQEQVVLFHGVEEDCEEALREFLLELQKLTDDAIPLPEPVFKILETHRGKMFVEDMVRGYPGCAAKVQDSQLFCASTTGEQLKLFKREFEGKVVRKICKVPPTLTATEQFKTLKHKLEMENMVMLTLPTWASEDVQLDGISGDVEMAVSELMEFTTQNRSSSKEFHIPGTLPGKACKQWFSKELDEAKYFILDKGTGKIVRESYEDGYTLVFQCRQEILSSVLNKLNAIKDNIKCVQIDLNKEFPKYSERALVINGLHYLGVGSFCSQLAEKLKESRIDSLGDFQLPNPCTLPQLSLKAGKGDASLRSRGLHLLRPEIRGDSGGHRGGHRHSSHHARSHPSLPCSVTVGGTTITIKSGDITEEKVGAAVCIVGQDLALKGTSIGSTFLKKCPSLAQTLQANGSAGGGPGECRLVTTPTAGSSLPMPFVFHAVLKKLQRPAVQKVVKDLVQQSLLFTVQNGQTSVALPPFGVGRKFGFGEYTTASSIAFAIKEFLQGNPNSVQTISIVVYDARLAGNFADIITKKLGVKASPAAPDAAVASTPTTPPSPVDEEDNSSDTGGDDDDDIMLEVQEAPDLSESCKETFEAQICTTQAEDCKKAIAFLLKELKTTFLWHETLQKDKLNDFFKLNLPVLQKILATASKTNVYLSITDRGLRMCGQKDDVNQLRADICSKLLLRHQLQSSKGWERRSRLGLPIDTDHLPSYWKVCRKEKGGKVSYDRALAAWSRRGIQLNTVTAEEKAEVGRLVQATWEEDKAGHGKDARNLMHTNVEVLRVERLENPSLWQEYSHRREQLFSKLEYRQDSSSAAAFTSIDKLPGSRGAIQTTANIASGSLLSRDIYHQVNEHYLFHGTKKAILNKIFGQGLDFRMANSRTMLGSAVYTAESSTKADQYTDFKQSRTLDEELTMILTRVLLGEPFIHKEPQPQAFKRPPCMSCSQRDCQCVNSSLFNSIVDDARLFREFVVYEQSVCYPEYIITYKRV